MVLDSMDGAGLYDPGGIPRIILNPVDVVWLGWE